MNDLRIKVIGVTGHPVSGKDTVADYLMTKGYKKISMGDILREKMKGLGISTERKNIHEFVKGERKRYGNSYPAGEVIEQINGNTVVAGFRNTEEIKAFRDRFGKDFILIAVEVPVHIRHARAQKRKRVGDEISLEQFKEEEHRERAADSGAHEVDRVVGMADIVIKNELSKGELFQDIDGVLGMGV